jgi:hypothetical protein
VERARLSSDVVEAGGSGGEVQRERDLEERAGMKEREGKNNFVMFQGYVRYILVFQIERSRPLQWASE